MQQTILITGHTGFVGTNLVRALADDSLIYGLDVPGSSALLPPERTFTWDAPGRLPGADAIIHLAGKAHDTAGTADPQAFFDINLGLTRRIFDHFLESDSQTFIFFSSVKAVADTLHDAVLSEDHVPDPKTPYGRSKLAAEQYIAERLGAPAKHLSPENDRQSLPPKGAETTTKGKRVFILRPAMIHGPGNKGNLNLLFNMVRRGIPWPLGAFDNQRSFASIGNVTYVVRRILTEPIAAGTYNLADDEPLATNELVRLIAASSGQKPRMLKVTPALVRAAARAGDLLHLPLNSERLKKLCENYVVSNRKIKNALRVNALPTAATEGIKQTLASFL